MSNDTTAFALDPDSASKDDFFRQIAVVAEAMSTAHGKEFAMGTLVLAARFIAERQLQPAASHDRTAAVAEHDAR